VSLNSAFRRALAFVAIPLLTVALAGCDILGPDDEKEEEEYKVLFIGNSYLGWHDTPLMFKNLAEAGGKTVTLGNQVVNGLSLQRLAEIFETTWMIRQASWDFVVVQSSGMDVAYPERSRSEHSIPWALAELKRIVQEHDAESELIWMVPWAFEDGITWTDGGTDDYAAMQEKIRAQAIHWSDSLGVALAPVGMAWYDVLKDGAPPHYLHDSDQSHPNMRGTYLTAATFYATLFQESVEGIDYFSILDQAEAQSFQEVASRIVLDDLSLWNITP
jgi:hypothetical protein